MRRSTLKSIQSQSSPFSHWFVTKSKTSRLLAQLSEQNHLGFRRLFRDDRSWGQRENEFFKSIHRFAAVCHLVRAQRLYRPVVLCTRRLCRVGLAATVLQRPNQNPAGAGWLTDFNDRTLEALVQEALANNPDLRVTAAKLDAAQAALRIAGADLTPSLTLKAATSRVKRNNTSGFSITSSRTERYTPSMDLAWELDIWGRLRDSQFSSRMDAEQAAANLQAARLSLAANTAKGWSTWPKPSCKPSSPSKLTKATPTTSPCWRKAATRPHQSVGCTPRHQRTECRAPAPAPARTRCLPPVT